MRTYICHHYKQDKIIQALMNNKLCITADKQNPSFTNCSICHDHFGPIAFEIMDSII